jgi:hypothetical protein
MALPGEADLLVSGFNLEKENDRLAKKELYQLIFPEAIKICLVLAATPVYNPRASLVKAAIPRQPILYWAMQNLHCK